MSDTSQGATHLCLERGIRSGEHYVCYYHQGHLGNHSWQVQPDTSQGDAVDTILTKLKENLSNEPGSDTAIGWERWFEEKEQYYAEAHAAIKRLIDAAEIRGIMTCYGMGGVTPEQQVYMERKLAELRKDG